MDHWTVPEKFLQGTGTNRVVVRGDSAGSEPRSNRVANRKKDCKGEGPAGLDRTDDGERTCKRKATNEPA